MRHPLDVIIAPEQRRNTLIVLAILTASVWLILWGQDLTTDKASHGILSFQLAGDPLVSKTILDSWVLGGKLDRAKIVEGLDYAFLLLYSTTLSLCCVWASKLWSGRVMTTIGVWLAWGQWAAALFNAIGDFVLLRLLTNAPSNSLTLPMPSSFATETARVCALLKFGLIEAGLIYIAISGLQQGLLARVRFLRLASRKSKWDTRFSSATQASTIEPPKAV